MGAPPGKMKMAVVICAPPYVPRYRINMCIFLLGIQKLRDWRGVEALSMSVVRAIAVRVIRDRQPATVAQVTGNQWVGDWWPSSRWRVGQHHMKAYVNRQWPYMNSLKQMQTSSNTYSNITNTYKQIRNWHQHKVPHKHVVNAYKSSSLDVEPCKSIHVIMDPCKCVQIHISWFIQCAPYCLTESQGLKLPSRHYPSEKIMDRAGADLRPVTGNRATSDQWMSDGRPANGWLATEWPLASRTTTNKSTWKAYVTSYQAYTNHLELMYVKMIITYTDAEETCTIKFKMRL